MFKSVVMREWLSIATIRGWLSRQVREEKSSGIAGEAARGGCWFNRASPLYVSAPKLMEVRW